MRALVTALALSLAAALPVAAQESPAAPNSVNDVAIPGSSIIAPAGARRYFALTYSPLTVMLARYGGTIEVVPLSHHALLLSVFYAYTQTNEDSNGNIFKGLGGELGYRYYFGHGGPRGLFLGPSFLLGYYDAVPRLGDVIHFRNLGVAADVGWQATVLDRLVLGISAGVQYTQPSVTLPVQELPAAIYANRSVMPRLNLVVGFCL